jgi:hypothetical protein
MSTKSASHSLCLDFQETVNGTQFTREPRTITDMNTFSFAMTAAYNIWQEDINAQKEEWKGKGTKLNC